MHHTYAEAKSQRLAPQNFSMPEWKVKTSTLIQFGVLTVNFVQLEKSADV